MMNKKFFNVLAAAFLCLSMCACDAKSLKAGLAESRKIYESEIAKKDNGNSSNEATVNKKTSSEASIEGLEMPAPLKKTPEIVLKRTGYTVSYNSDRRGVLLLPILLATQNEQNLNSMKTLTFQSQERWISIICVPDMTADTCVQLVIISGAAQQWTTRFSSPMCVHRLRRSIVETGTRWSRHAASGQSNTAIYI